MTLKEIFEILNTSKTVQRCIKNLGGELIGSGLYRDVYSIKGTNRYVLKVERDMTQSAFCNATEFRNYIDNREWKNLSQWLAPCHIINENGNVMIQSRVKHKDPKFYPKQIPNVFTDTKYTNFGWIGKRFVACDYPVFIQTSLRMKKCSWWGLSEKQKNTGKKDLDNI